MIELLPTGTVTLLLADIEDSPRLRESEPERFAAASARLDRTLSHVIAAHGGVRAAAQGIGDGFLVAFARASDAVSCAVALQRVPLAPIRLRIGLDTGEVQLRDEGDYAGPTINRAAQLRAVAHGGQTVLSRATQELLADRLPPDCWLTDLGTYGLPGMSHFERIVQLCHRDLVNDFPPLRVQGEVVGRHLPAPLTSFVGREIELADLRRLVSSNRLVTLTGSGGVGKTRLAVQLAGQLAAGFADGAWWVDLAAITDPDLVTVRVARTLSLPDLPGRSMLETLTRFIGTGRVLVVLDNCEHLVEACAALIGAVLGACPAVTILATSREPIGVAGEMMWRTPSLSLADEAVELFTDRARLARPDLVVTGDDGAVVSEICQRLDGVPLAIELAAARVRALSLGEIVDGLRDRFRLLTGGARNALPRQQTLRASVDWSHALLSDRERVLFRRLAVFLGGFDLDAAYAVAGGADVPRNQLMEELSLLVDKSLVVAHSSQHTTRYRMLETVRQYALEKLGESGETDAMRTRHRDHYTAVFDAPVSADHQQRVERAEIEIDNLRAAFACSREHGDVELASLLASGLQPLWLTRARILEGLDWFDAVLADAATTAPAARARALADKLVLDHLAGAFDSLDQAEQALAIARDLDEPKLLAQVLTACGVARIFSAVAAAPYFAEATELIRALGDDWQLSWVLGWQADSGYIAGNPTATRTAAEEGRDLADAIGDEVLSRMCRWFLGMAQWLSAELGSAAAQFNDVAVKAQVSDDRIWSAYGLYALGRTLAYQGDTPGARAAAEAAVAVAEDMTEIQQTLAFGALADAALAEGDVEAATAAIDAAQRAGPQVHLLAVNGYPVAQTALAQGDLSAARRWADEIISIASGGHRMIVLATRVRIAIAQNDLGQADHDAHEALAIAAEIGAYLTIPDVIECLAALVADSGRHPEAARLFGSAQGIRDRTGQVRFKVYDADFHASVARLRETMGRSGFEDRWAEGAALSTSEAVAYAQRGHAKRKRPASGWASLTPTECDVVRLISEGLANKDVAARLFISPRTVQTHLRNVYTKLGVNSRVQLAQEAARHA